ncbi:unnamed protein product, partial [Symbiodinium sp. CCMP2456]
FLAKLESGDLVLEMDLITSCQNKDEKWHPRDNACLAEILNSLAADKDGKGGTATTDSKMADAKAALDNQAYQLMVEEIGYDEQCLDVYQRKLQDFAVRVIHQKDTWLKKRLDRASDAARQWWDTK